MAAGALSASRRVNVTPTSSIVQVGMMEDVDCSGTSFTKTPEDGEFVVVTGSTGVTNALIYTDPAPTINTLTGQLLGSGLRMVWGSAQRSDRAATGQQRVNVFKRAARVKTKLFQLLDTAKVPSHADNKWAGGRLVSVVATATTIQGAANRLIPTVMLDDESGWAVGRVERVVTDSLVAGTGEIEISLFDAPMWIDR